MTKPVDGAEALAHKVLSDFGRFPSAGAVPYFVTVEAMLAHSAALVAENERLAKALDLIAFHSTNHGGWFESDPIGEYAKLGDIARTALETRNG